jgi:hypothetical protein
MTRAIRSRHFWYIKGTCELDKSHIISTDEDLRLQTEHFALINIRGVSTNKKSYTFYRHAIRQRI